MRKTSLEALRKMLAARCLGNSYKIVLDNLVKCRGLTGRELCKKAGREGLWKRLSELRGMGLVEEVGVRKCSVSGCHALTWRLARKLPRARAKPVDKKNKWFIVLAAKAKDGAAFKDRERAGRYAKRRGLSIVQTVESKGRSYK